jgi:hypothetical protein
LPGLVEWNVNIPVEWSPPNYESTLSIETCQRI